MSRINGQKASSADLDILEQDFQDIPQRGNAFQDRTLDAREITQLFDQNRDGKISFAEIDQMRVQMAPEIFWKAQAILKKHGYDLFRNAKSISFEELQRSPVAGEYLANRSCALALIDNDASNIQRVHPEFRFQKAFMFDALMANAEVVRHLDASTILYFNTQDLNIARGITHSLSLQDSLILLAPEGLLYLDPPVVGQAEFMTRAVKLNPGAYRYASQELKEGDAFSMPFLIAHPELICHAPEKYKHDMDLFFSAIIKDINLFSEFDPALLDNASIIVDAMQIDARIFFELSPQWQQNNYIISRFFALKPSKSLITLNLMNSSLIHNIPFARQYLIYQESLDEGLPPDFHFFDEKVRKDPEINEFLWTIFDRADLLHPEYVKSLSAAQILKIVQENKNILALLEDPVQKSEVFALLLPQLRKEGIPPLSSFAKDAESFFAALNSVTRSPNRFRNYNTIYVLWENRQEIENNSDPRPITLILYGSKDWNRAFEVYPLMDQYVLSGKSRVLYFENDLDDEAFAHIRAVTQGGRRPLQSLVFGGHGSATTLSFGGEDLGISLSRKIEESEYLDVSDFQEDKWKRLAHYLKANATILLVSCSNGAGGFGASNLANAVAAVLPNSIRVLSSQVPSNIERVEINAGQQNIQDVEFWDSDATYAPQGQQSEPSS